MKTLTQLTLLSIALWLPCFGAQAQQISEADKAAAMKHFEQGQSQIAEGSFDAAYRSFLSGYQLSGKPLFLFNMAECSRELGKRDRAVRDYQMYLSQDPNGKLAAKAKERLKELNAEPAQKSEQPSSADKAEIKASSAIKAPPVADPVKPEHQPSAVDRSISPAPPEDEDDGSFFTSAPFWIGVGVVVVAGSVTAIALASSGSDPSCEGSCSDLRGSF